MVTCRRCSTLDRCEVLTHGFPRPDRNIGEQPCTLRTHIYTIYYKCTFLVFFQLCMLVFLFTLYIKICHHPREIPTFTLSATIICSLKRHCIQKCHFTCIYMYNYGSMKNNNF